MTKAQCHYFILHLIKQITIRNTRGILSSGSKMKNAGEQTKKLNDLFKTQLQTLSLEVAFFV